MIFGFSEYSLRLEAVEVWEEFLDIVSELADADAAAENQEEASPAQAAAQDDGARSAVLDRVDAAVEYADSHWAADDADQASDLVSLVPPPGIASIDEPNAPAMRRYRVRA